jgi:glycosyltransferase involved in cell wall biosynthesis
VTSTGGMRILVTVTFNDNQLRAHLLPVATADCVQEVVLVADRIPGVVIPKVRVVVPPPLLRRVVGRALAKTVTCTVLARRWRPDWVIGLNIMPHGINAYLAARACGASVLYHQIGGTREWRGGGWDSDNAILGRLRKPSKVLEALLFLFIRHCDIVAVMGQRGRSELIDCGLDPERVYVIPGAVTSPTPVSSEGSEAEPEDHYDVICVGELIPVKRIHDVISAVANLQRSTGVGVRTAIVGAGPLQEELERQVRTCGLTDFVDILGFRSDVQGLLSRSSVFVLPSAYEGLSIALLDAMAAGLAVVSTDVGEIRDVVIDGVNGMIYNSGDVPALTTILSRLVASHQLRSVLGHQAHKQAMDYASVPVTSRTVVAALESRPTFRAAPRRRRARRRASPRRGTS